MFESCRVEQRFENAARRTWRTGDIDPFPIAVERQIAVAAIGCRLTALHLDDNRCQIPDPLLSQFPVPTHEHLLHTVLKTPINVSHGALSVCLPVVPLHQMRSILGHRIRFADQRLFQGQRIVLLVDLAFGMQTGQQPVAFGQQLIAVPGQMDTGRRILQHGECGGFGP